MKSVQIHTILLLVLIVYTAKFSEAALMGTTWTYQGRLVDANSTADGLYDFQFKLYDSNDPSSSTQLGDVIDVNNIDVIDGYFTAELDFGSDVNVFHGQKRWLEIGVRYSNTTDIFTILSPRQEIRPTPYAIYAKSAGLQVPIQVSGSFEFPAAVIEATNTSTENGYAIVGLKSETGTLGYLGGYYGVYGRHNSLNYGILGSSDYGVYGRNINENHGYLGSESYGVYGSSISGTAGYFTSRSGYGLVVESGNVGIGTISPQVKLDVNGPISTDSVYAIAGSTVLSTLGSQNIFVGSFAGYSNTTGNENTFLGSWAGRRNTSGEKNTFVGFNAGYTNTIGNNNTFLGRYAGYHNISGHDNIFVGLHAGHTNATGNDNTFLGNFAGYRNTKGGTNTFIGGGAGYSNTEGSDNTFSGCQAGNSNTTGNYNTFAGRSAGWINNTGNYNTFLGNHTGYRNTSGEFNIALGSYANFYNEEGSRNTVIGYRAGQGSTYHNKSGSVFLGCQAGFYETGSNTLYIANGPEDSNTLIYGDFSTGNVGIGTTNPLGKLDVNGSIYQRGSLLHADYVFESDYDLESIDEHSDHMWRQKHLPSIPKAGLDENGREILEVGAHRRGIVEELEKAHIYIEQLHKRINTLEETNKEISTLQKQMKDLQEQIAQLKYRIE